MTSVQVFQDHSAANRVIAHRGWPTRYPENSLAGFSAAIDHGARILECDVQLTADRVPVLIHDATLDRTTHASGSLLERRFTDLHAVSLRGGEPSSHRIAPLAQLLRCPALQPPVQLLLDLKPESLLRFGRSQVLDAVLPVCAQCDAHIALIAYDAELLALARQRSHHAIGWILGAADEANRAQATALAPDLLLVSTRHLDNRGATPWTATPPWALYTVNDPETARARLASGFHAIETDDIGALLEALQ